MTTVASRVRSRSRSPARRRSNAGSAPPAWLLAESPRGVFHVRVWMLMLLIVGGGSLAAWRVHYREHGVLNNAYLALSFFLVLNALIAFCELNLHFRAARVARRTAVLERCWGGASRQQWRSALHYFTTRVTLSSVWSDVWTDMWAAYGVFDPCYANTESFGFWIDTGNGILTLLPSLALLHNLTFDTLSDTLLAPRYMAMLQALLFWTEFYGTVVYAAAFVYHGRLQTIGWRNTLLFVVLTNGLWAVLPLLGLYCMVDVIDTDSFRIFRQ